MEGVDGRGEIWRGCFGWEVGCRMRRMGREVGMERRGVGEVLPSLELLCPAGGAGTYVVLQCGSAGHNIRSKPSLQGTPVGRLKLGDTFQVEDEVGTRSAVPVMLKLIVLVNTPSHH